MEMTRGKGEGGGNKSIGYGGINVLVAMCMNVDEFHNIIKSERSQNFLKEYNCMLS